MNNNDNSNLLKKVAITIYNSVNIINELASSIMIRLLSNFMKRRRTAKGMQMLKTGDIVKGRFESANELNSESLVAHSIHNLNDNRIVPHITADE